MDPLPRKKQPTANASKKTCPIQVRRRKARSQSSVPKNSQPSLASGLPAHLTTCPEVCSPAAPSLPTTSSNPHLQQHSIARFSLRIISGSRWDTVAYHVVSGAQSTVAPGATMFISTLRLTCQFPVENEAQEEREEGNPVLPDGLRRIGNGYETPSPRDFWLNLNNDSCQVAQLS